MKLDRMPAVMAALVVFALLQSAAIIVQTLLLSSVISSLWSGSSPDSQIAGIVGFLSCFALLRIVRFAQDAMLERYSLRQAQGLRQQLLSCIFDARVLLARKVGSPVAATTATEGIDQVQLYIRVIPPKVVGMLAISLPVLVATFLLDWVSGVILAVMLPVTISFMILLGRQASARAERQYASYTRLTGRFMDTLRGLGVIKAFGASAAEGKSVYEYSERLRAATVRTLSTATLSSAVLDLCTTFGVAAVAMMLAFRLMDGSINLMTALAALVLAPEYFLPIRAFASDFHASLNGKNALRAVLEMLGAGRQQTRQTPNAPIADWNASSELEVDGACYSYGTVSSGVGPVSLHASGFQKIAIVGRSGAGKSTLAGILAGFLDTESGRVLIDGKPADLTGPEWKRQVRYIPQNPYLFNLTLRENIAFYAPDAPEDAIMDAVKAVGLEELVGELPEGLDTVIGEGAQGFSGGQAHRIALARILLDDSARVLVFDEPTAHLDIETELELKREMLRVMEGRLVFFATHRLHWLQDMDCVIELDQGCVTRAFEPAAKGSSPSISNDGLGNLGVCREGVPPLPQTDGNLETPSDGCDQERCEQNLCTSDLGACRKGATPLPQTEEDEGMLSDSYRRGRCRRSLLPAGSEKNELERNAKAPTWLSDYVLHYKRWVIVAVALGFASAGCSVLLMFTSGYLISATAMPSTTLFSIMVPIALVQVFGLGRPLAHYVERLVSHDWVLKITSDLRRALFWGVEGRVGDPSRERATGEYLGLLSDDVDHLQNLYLRVDFPIAIAALLSLVAAIFFFAFSPLAGACMLLALAMATVALPWMCRKLTQNRSHTAKTLRAREYRSLTDDIMGATDWVLSNRTQDVKASHARSDGTIRTLDYSSHTTERLVSLAAELLLGSVACLIIVWSGHQFGSNPPTANWIAAFALGFFPLVEILGALPSSAAQAAVHEDAIDRLDEYVSAGEEEACSSLPEPSAQEQRCEDAGNALELDSVEYSYPNSSAKALAGITLSIRAGESVAILGRSGSGKSTLANIMRGILEPDSGTVRISAEGILPLGYLGQTPYLFNRSLRDNLTLGTLAASDGELAETLESVGLASKLSSLENGLDTIVGETGVGFSGGEAHRIALARVLVANAPIVLIDEPFSALDPVTEAGLLETLFDVCADRTLIVITHHLAEIERFDRVVFVEQGSVALDGTPEGLAQQSDFFRTLLEFDNATLP